jgi:hypothetical protein
MHQKLKLSLLACTLAAASVAGAQTSSQTDIPPPNDIIRLPHSVTTPAMPVMVEPPRDDIGRGTPTPGAIGSRPAQPFIRSLGSDAIDTLGDGSTLGAGSTMGAGAATGSGSTVSGTATATMPGESRIGRVNGAASSAGSGGPIDIGGVNGARSSAGLNGAITPSSGGAGGIFGNATSDSAAGGSSGSDATGSNAGFNGNAGDGAATSAPSGQNNPRAVR